MLTFFNHSEAFPLEDQEFPNLSTKMHDIRLGVRHTSQLWKNLEFEVIFEEPRHFIVQFSNLIYLGKGFFKDAESGANEKVSFKCPINNAQFIFKLSHQVMEWGAKWPKIEVELIAFQLQEDLATVTLRGNLPLYKQHNFEEEIKTYFVK